MGLLQSREVPTHPPGSPRGPGLGLKVKARACKRLCLEVSPSEKNGWGFFVPLRQKTDEKLLSLQGCQPSGAVPEPQEGCVFVFYGFPFYFPVQSSGQARRLRWVRCGSGRAPQRASSSVCPSVLLSAAGLWGWRGGLAPKCCKSWGTPSHPFPPTHFQARQKLVWAGKRGKAPPHSQGLVSPTWLMGPTPGAAQPVPCPRPGFNLRAQPRLLGLRVALGTG